MVFILKDNKVLFTIIKDQYKLNLSTLTSHLFLRHDLKNYLIMHQQMPANMGTDKKPAGNKRFGVVAAGSWSHRLFVRCCASVPA
jgi:hypothetical protein